MTTRKFSATSTATTATSISVALGGAPAVGDLVVVWLGVDNQIVTHQPFYNDNRQWMPLMGGYYRDKLTNATLTVWAHTWNSNDSGSSVTFTFSPAPSLGIGDKDVSSANACAVAMVFDGSLSSVAVKSAPYGTQDAAPNLGLPNLHTPAGDQLWAAVLTSTNATTATFSPAESNGVTATVAKLWLRVGQVTQSSVNLTLVGVPYENFGSHVLSIRDIVGNFTYVAPALQEADPPGSQLMFRYRPLKGYTVLNTTGVWTAVRYQTTDQVSAATQVFSGDTVCTATDRTNILNNGVGGEFRAVP